MRGVFGFLLVAWPALAWADSYEDLAEELSKQVRDLARNVAELESEGHDAGDVRQVIRSLDDIIDVLGDMEDYEDSVDGLDRIISGYESDLAGLSNALDALADMKELTGEIEPMVQECADLDRAFLRYMHDDAPDLVPALDAGDPDEDAVDPELLEEARETVRQNAIGIAEEAEARLELGRDVISDIDRFVRAATSPRMAHSDLREVKSAMEEAAFQTHVTEQGHLAELEDACSPLINYEDHRAFTTVLLRFSEQAGGMEELADDFVREAEEWLAANERIGTEICDDLEVLRRAYCDYDAEPNERNPLYSRYDSAADDVADAFLRRIEVATREYDRNLAGIGRALQGYDNVTEDLYDRMRKRMAYYYKLESSEVLAGANNPQLRLWRLYGIEQHNRLQRDPNCHLTERAIPGTSGSQRVDCINIRSCDVIEFKPDSDSGRRDAAKVNDYVRSLNSWLEDRWSDIQTDDLPNASYSSASEFDDDFVLQARVAGCINDEGEANFTGVPYFYDRCSKVIPLQCEP